MTSPKKKLLWLVVVPALAFFAFRLATYAWSQRFYAIIFRPKPSSVLMDGEPIQIRNTGGFTWRSGPGTHEMVYEIGKEKYSLLLHPSEADDDSPSVVVEKGKATGYGIEMTGPKLLNPLR